MTLVHITGEERNQRLASYVTEDNEVDLWLMMVDFVSYAKEMDKTLGEAQGLLERIWDSLELETTQ